MLVLLLEIEDPVQPAVGDPALAGGARWPTEVPSNPEHSVILWFCPFLITWLVFKNQFCKSDSKYIV